MTAKYPTTFAICEECGDRIFFKPLNYKSSGMQFRFCSKICKNAFHLKGPINPYYPNYPPKGAMIIVICQYRNCHKEFVGKIKQQNFCCRDCGISFYNLFYYDQRRGRIKYKIR